MKSVIELPVRRRKPCFGAVDAARDRSLGSGRLALSIVRPERDHLVPKRWIASAARDKADRLKHHQLLVQQGNLDSSAGTAMPGKLPSPATSRTRGGASVVVGARESRAHGEGRQSCV
jgi:hypothetical protein